MKIKFYESVVVSNVWHYFILQSEVKHYNRLSLNYFYNQIEPKMFENKNQEKSRFPEMITQYERIKLTYLCFHFRFTNVPTRELYILGCAVRCLVFRKVCH
jgi:hypothetical protein